jgi:hypothetical protein
MKESKKLSGKEANGENIIKVRKEGEAVLKRSRKKGEAGEGEGE